uniref:Beta-microseminoprotein n=1 Tax=Chelydra serpentina TaxID=8475 RepID=A0A8C3T7P5_CHESE
MGGAVTWRTPSKANSHPASPLLWEGEGDSDLILLYHFGVVWKTKDCFRCECQPRAMICCSLVFRPTNYDRENCIALFHRKSCSMRVVWKSDPQEPCNVFAGVG